MGADGVVASAVLASADEVMSRALSTLAIHDWSVFGGSEDDEVEGGED